MTDKKTPFCDDLGNLIVEGDLEVDGSAVVGGKLVVRGDLTIEGTLTVNGHKVEDGATRGGVVDGLNRQDQFHERCMQLARELRALLGAPRSIFLRNVATVL